MAANPGITPDSFPIPPKEYFTLITGNPDMDPDAFLTDGRWHADHVLSFLRTEGIEPAGLSAILDFGCGVARILRHFINFDARLYGSDINSGMIAWCRENLPFAEFEVNSAEPPTGYADASFDFIMALSVFTHLPEDSQSAWLAEMRRILVPGSALLVSTHGEAFVSDLNAAERKDYRAGGLVVRNGDLANDPEAYGHCAAFHSRASVARLAKEHGFEIVGHDPGGPGVQDYWLLRCKPPRGRRKWLPF